MEEDTPSTVSGPRLGPREPDNPTVTGEDHSETADYQHLPDHILEQIFSHLKQSEVYLRVALVCRRWRALVGRRCPCPHLQVPTPCCGRDLLAPGARRVLPTAFRLRSLELQGRPDAGVLLSALPPGCRGLRRLALSECTGLLGEGLSSTLEHCPALSSLQLSNCILVGCDGLRAACRGLAALRSLALTEVQTYGEIALRDFLTGSEAVEEVRATGAIYLQEPFCDDPDLLFVAQRFPHSLAVLEVDTLGLGDPALEALAGCSQLRTLGIHMALDVHKLAAQCRSQSLPDQFGWFGPSAASWVRLFRTAAWAAELRSLRFSHCSGVDDDVAAAVADRCARLEKLCLVRTHVTERGVALVRSACPHLVAVDA